MSTRGSPQTDESSHHTHLFSNDSDSELSDVPLNFELEEPVFNHRGTNHNSRKFKSRKRRRYSTSDSEIIPAKKRRAAPAESDSEESGEENVAWEESEDVEIDERELSKFESLPKEVDQIFPRKLYRRTC